MGAFLLVFTALVSLSVAHKEDAEHVGFSQSSPDARLTQRILTTSSGW